MYPLNFDRKGLKIEVIQQLTEHVALIGVQVSILSLNIDFTTVQLPKGKAFLYKLNTNYKF